MTADTHSVLSGLKPLSRLDHPREMIRQFTPNWFAATMGTGILALALPQVPGIGLRLNPSARCCGSSISHSSRCSPALWRALGDVRARGAAHLRA
jgi:hypothetical protein